MEIIDRTKMRTLAPVLVALSMLGLGCTQADPMVAMGSLDTGGDPSPTGAPGPAPDTTAGPAPGPTMPDRETTGGQGEDTTEGPPPPPPPSEGDYYPLADGATWTYRHTTQDGIVWDEIVEMVEVTFDGRPAYEQADNEGSNGESTISTMLRDGSQVLRVHKEVSIGGAPLASVDYDPGFLRFDHAWQEGDAIVWTYDRVETDPSGVVIDDSPRNQIFTVESLSVEVEVPAGTFQCVQVLRERLETGELKRFWFAHGVGKVKHLTINTGATEELVEYSIP